MKFSLSEWNVYYECRRSEENEGRAQAHHQTNIGIERNSGKYHQQNPSLDEFTGIQSSADAPESLALVDLYEKMIDEKNRLIKWLMAVCCILIAVFVFIVLFDLINGNIGFVQY